MPPEDELSDEVPLRDENEGEPSPSDSSVDFAADDGAEVPSMGEAPDVDPYAFQDYDGPTEDLSGELADDAGAEASYGYDTASETARFDRPDIDPSLLAESAGTPDESGQYKISPSDSSVDQGGFVEEAAVAGSSDEVYEPAVSSPDESGGYASHHPDMVEDDAEAGHVSFGAHAAADADGGYTGAEADDGYTGAEADDGYTGAEADGGYTGAEADGGYTGYAAHDDGDAGAAVGAEVDEAPAAQGFSVEEDPPAAQGFSVEEEAPAPAPAATRAPPPATPPARKPAAVEKASDEVRPGQVRKSAIDEMFARAAQIKREKGR
ncbi:MAG: hypothetical protein KF878_11680 [Planctomycetes bacterium]|nr:hypothetical protein [Planctomycetota bacterium]